MSNNWKTQCNYRKIRQADGSVKNIIFVDRQKVEVTDEVYKAYSQMGRQERYQEEQRNELPQVSFEKLCEASVPIDLYITEQPSPSAEDEVMAEFDATECDRMIALLPQVLDKLSESDRAFMQALFTDGIPAREYARYLGISDMAIRKRRDRILSKLQDFLTFFLQ